MTKLWLAALPGRVSVNAFVFLSATMVSILVLSACGTDDEPVAVEAGATGATDNEAGASDSEAGASDSEAGATDNEAGDGDLPGEILGAGPYPIATLEVSVTHPENDPVDYTVTCLGDTATLTPQIVGLSDQAACLTLADPAAQDLLLSGPPTDRICTEIYGGPDEAAISGTMDDQQVDVVITRTNGCGISDWDVTLAGLLPAPNP